MSQAMLSDYDTVDVARGRAVGGLSAFIYLFTVSLCMPSPGDATNGQPLALSLPHRSPSRRLKWCGLPPARTNDLANPPSAVAVGSVARYMDVELRKPTPAFPGQLSSCEEYVVLSVKSRRTLGRCGASCVGMIAPGPSSPSSTSTTAPA